MYYIAKLSRICHVSRRVCFEEWDAAVPLRKNERRAAGQMACDWGFGKVFAESFVLFSAFFGEKNVFFLFSLEVEYC